ncbi:MAG TPA: hypothetical protein VFS43_40805 [Polyangiaceae bacterium]|nr:hypothetical protein [Polyangiaceae bacterium]
MTTREELYREIWGHTQQWAKEHYRLSWDSIKEVCRCLEVPVWKRSSEVPIVRGKLVLPPLPRASYEVEAEETARRVREEVAARTAQGAEILRTSGVDLEPQHPLVRKASPLLRRQKPDDDGILRVRDQPCLAIDVSPNSLGRALAVMNALLKALEAAGHDVKVTTPDDPRDPRAANSGAFTRTLIDGEWVAFSLLEGAYAVPRPPKPKLAPGEYLPFGLKFANWPRQTSRPDGKLWLRAGDTVGAGGRRNWGDETAPVESLIPAFVVGLTNAARRFKEARAKEEERERRRLERARDAEAARQERERVEQLEREERERLERLEAEKRQAYEAKVRRLKADVRAWRLAGEIRTYVEVMRASAEAAGVPIDPDSELEEELAFALQYADQIDPSKHIVYE